MLKDLAKDTLAKLGFRLSRIPKGRAFGADPFVDARRILAKHDPVLFDVGANIGQTVAHVREIFTKPVIHSFEPSLATFGLLEAATKGVPEVHLNRIGLGAKPGELAFHEHQHSELSSVLPFGSVGGQVVASSTVPISTVDDYCLERSIDRIDILKIDTQGYDYEVLMGAGRMLRERRVGFILSEVILSDQYKNIARSDQMLGYMLDCRYTPFCIYNQNWVDGHLSWFDMAFVPKNLS